MQSTGISDIAKEFRIARFEITTVEFKNMYLRTYEYASARKYMCILTLKYYFLGRTNI